MWFRTLYHCEWWSPNFHTINILCVWGIGLFAFLWLKLQNFSFVSYRYRYVQCTCVPKSCPKHYYYYYYYYYYTIWMSLVTDLFILVLLLNQRRSPLLRLQASHCSTFRIMCNVPSIAVFCSESIQRFPGTVSKFFFKLLVTIPVAPIITGTIVHFRFHIRCISIHKLYFNFFSASFCTTFLSAGIATSISVHVFLFLFLISISGLFAVTSLSVCTAWLHNTVTSPSSHTGFIIIIIIIIIIKSFKNFLEVMPLEDWTDTPCRNVGNNPAYPAQQLKLIL